MVIAARHRNGTQNNHCGVTGKGTARANDRNPELGGNILKKPRIGIVGSILTTESGPIPGIERAYVNDDYIQAAEKAGGVPILLPVVNHEECILAQIESCSGLLFTGGQDIHPKFYASEAHLCLGDVNTRVDEYQLKLIRSALESGKPILAICRGHQLLNVACGGTLLQDLSEAPNECLTHFQNGSQSEVIHQVKTASGCILEGWLGSEFLVNSYHHQAIRDVGTDLTVIAASTDGVIEAIQMSDRDFVLGVQWHPERMVAKTDQMMVLFEQLVKATIKADVGIA
jgi:putative glutamine amidotransferase